MILHLHVCGTLTAQVLPDLGLPMSAQALLDRFAGHSMNSIHLLLQCT